MSVHRNYALGSRLPHPANYVMCSYSSPDGYNAPFPWRFNKQTQAIDLEFINGFDASTDINDSPMYVRGHSLRAAHNVMGLGPNFVAWMEGSEQDGDGNSADVGSVVMTEHPIICDANVVCPREDPNDGGSNFSTEPISFESSAGPLVSDYLKTMIFLKPLVVRYTVGGTTLYRYFSNNFEGNT